MNRRRTALAAAAVGVVAFLATRFAFLDRDLPPWALAQYQPIDEAAYTLPAFNLHLHGTWTYQAAPWVPVEGPPSNVFQSLVTAGTLALDWSYWGFRGSSVLFGLVAFLALLGIVANLVRRAERDGVVLPWPAGVLLVATGLLLLVDFSFLLGGRVVEATIPRLCSISVLLWLVARGTLLGPAHSGGRSLAMGFGAGALVGFGYIYNAFLIPGVLLAVAGWGWSRVSHRRLAGHLLLALAGVVAALGAYLLWIAVTYGLSPVEWYEHWLAPFRTAGRATGIDITGLWDLVVGNIFRLDRPFFALTVAMFPVFAWWTARSRDPLGIAVLALVAMFAVQCTVQSDYPQRKMLVLLAFAVPIAVGGLLRLGELRDWIERRPRAAVAAFGWLAFVVLGTLALTVPPRLAPWPAFAHLVDLPPAAQTAFRDGVPGRLLALGAVTGLAAVVALVVGWRRPAVARVAGAVLLASMLVPLVALDVRYVFTRATWEYRDAMRGVLSLPDHDVIAGEHADAMLLYNDAESALWGYWYQSGLSITEYEELVVRWFQEGRSRWMFAYADAAGLERWERLGFRLVEAYPIPLPNDRVMGRYELASPSAP